MQIQASRGGRVWETGGPTVTYVIRSTMGGRGWWKGRRTVGGVYTFYRKIRTAESTDPRMKSNHQRE